MSYGTLCRDLASLAFGRWALRRQREQDRVVRQVGSCALLSGLGLGVGLMYFLDSSSGRRRRSLVIDQLGSLARRSKGAAEARARDARNRLQGIAHDAGRIVRREEAATGSQLADQIRSRMGRLVSHPHAIDVSVEDGRVVLEGPILAKEADPLVSVVARMRGVDHVDDRLSRFENPEGIPALQEGTPRDRARNQGEGS